jgi:HSP20 family protein
MQALIRSGSPFVDLLDNIFPNLTQKQFLPDFELTPCVDVVESEAGYSIKADLPGLSKEDISIKIEDGILSISGEKKREVEKKGQTYCYERSYGKFTRSFTLPNDADPKKIEAQYQNGVLDIMLSKKEESKPQGIEVKVK